MVGGVLALFAFIVYAYTAMPSIPPEDAGEIATSVHALGILHPTGYPLFTLLGHAWLDLPFDGRVIVRLNLLMAVIGTATVFLLYRLLLSLLRRALPGAASGAHQGASFPGAEDARRLAAAGGALALAFSRMAWTNAGSLEVYSLHLLFLALVTLLFTTALPHLTKVENVRAAPSVPAPPARTWLLFAYVLGLSFSNHMMTVLLAPAFLFLFFAAYGPGMKAWGRIALAAPPFLLGLSPYLYLPIRASADPMLNWGNITTLPNFLQHVSGAQYRFKMFTSLDTALSKGKAFFYDLPSDFGYLPLLLAAAGLVLLARRAPRLLAFTLLIFVMGAVYEANYAFPDFNFRLNAHFAVAICAAAGIFGLARLVAKHSQELPIRLATVLCVMAAAAPLSANFPEMNRHDEYAVEDYAINVLASTEAGSVILTDEEWTMLFPAMYLQRVEGYRPDVAILHPSAMLIAWNQEYIRRTTPWVFESAPEEKKVLLELSKDLFAADNLGDRAMRRGMWEQVAKRIVRKNAQERPVHATFLLFFNANDFGNLAQEYAALPVGLTFQLFPDSFPIAPMPVRIPVYHPIRTESEMGLSLRSFYPDVYYNRGVYEAGFLRDTAAAVRSFLKAQELLPGHPMSREWLVKLGVWR